MRRKPLEAFEMWMWILKLMMGRKPLEAFEMWMWRRILKVTMGRKNLYQRFYGKNRRRETVIDDIKIKKGNRWDHMYRNNPSVEHITECSRIRGRVRGRPLLEFIKQVFKR